MAKYKDDAGCPDDRIIRVYNYSFIGLMRKASNESPTQFNQRRMLVLDYVIKVANLIHLVTKQAYEKINIVVRRAYEDGISMKNIGFNMFGKGSLSFYENLCHPEINHLKIDQLQPAGNWLFERYGSLFKIDPSMILPGYRRICSQGSAKIVQICVENMICETFIIRMNSTIATYLDRHGLKRTKNVTIIRRLICGCTMNTFRKEDLDNIGGYRFIQHDEFKAPNKTIVDESSLEKFVWNQKNMLRQGAVNKNNIPIDESWVEKNMERSLFYQLFALNYQCFNEVSQQPDTRSKKWNIIPKSSDMRQNIVINNEILYYIGAYARYFDNKNLGKIQVLSKRNLKLSTLKDNVMKSSGFYDVLWDAMFHPSLQDALKANRDIPALVIPGNITTGINISSDGLPLVIEGTSRVGTVKVFFDRNQSRNSPTTQRFKLRQLVPGGMPIDVTKRDVFGNYMRTDGVTIHVNRWILKSADANNDDTEVQKIGPTYGKNSHIHLLKIRMQQHSIDELILLEANHSETPNDRKIRRNKNKKMKRRHKKIMEKISDCRGNDYLVVIRLSFRSYKITLRFSIF